MGRIDRSGRVGVPPGPPFQTVGTGGIRLGRLPRWLKSLTKLVAILDLGTQSRLARTPPPGQVKPPFQLLKTANLPQIHLGRRTNDMHQVDIDIGGPFATRWTKVASLECLVESTGQKKLSNMPLFSQNSTEAVLASFASWARLQGLVQSDG